MISVRYMWIERDVSQSKEPLFIFDRAPLTADRSYVILAVRVMFHRHTDKSVKLIGFLNIFARIPNCQPFNFALSSVMSFARSASNLAFNLSARSLETMEPDRILYFESVEDAEDPQVTVKGEEFLDAGALRDIVLQLQKQVDHLFGLIKERGHEGILKGVGKAKESLQDCLDEIEHHGNNRKHHEAHQVEWKRAIWQGEFESLQDNVNEKWKPAIAILHPKDPPLYSAELDAILISARNGLANVKSRFQAGPILSRLNLDIDMGTAGTNDRQCRITFHSYREQHDPKERRSRYSDRRSQVFTLQTDTAESCCTSLLQDTFICNYGIPNSLLLHAGEEARRTIDQMRRTQAASMNPIDDSVSISSL